MSVLSQLAHIFPPPTFITLPNAGVDISDASLKYVQFEKGKKHLEIKHWGDIDVPEQTVRRGSLVNKEALVEVLREVRKRCGVEYIRVSLPEERAYLFETSVKRGTKFKDIQGLLEFRLEENVPISPRDAFFDYEIVGDGVEENEIRISVAVYARETIAGYYDACISSDLVPLSFEVEAQAIARAAVRTGDEGTHMIVDFGRTRTGVGIVHKGALMFTSTIDIGGMQLSDVLRRQVGDADEEEMTRIKNEQGLLRTGESSKVYTALLSPISALRDELSMRINYWNVRDENADERHIEKIILCGGSVNLAGLSEYFTEELGVETKRAMVWQNAFSMDECIPPITRRYSYGYATAIGLALKDFV